MFVILVKKKFYLSVKFHKLSFCRNLFCLFLMMFKVQSSYINRLTSFLLNSFLISKPFVKFNRNHQNNCKANKP